MRLRHRAGRRRIPFRAHLGQPREQRSERQHQRLLGLPAEPVAGRSSAPTAGSTTSTCPGAPARPLHRHLAEPGLPRQHLDVRGRHRRATSGPPPRSTAPGPRTSRGWSSVCTSRASRSASTRATSAPTSPTFSCRSASISCSTATSTSTSGVSSWPHARAAPPWCRGRTTAPAWPTPTATLAHGAGTVFATVGTGGTALRDVTATDPEAGYFAASSGLNSNPTWGNLDVSATADQLTARFLPAIGGNFTDSLHHLGGACECLAGRGVHADVHRPRLYGRRLGVDRLRRDGHGLCMGLRGRRDVHRRDRDAHLCGRGKLPDRPHGDGR